MSQLETDDDMDLAVGLSLKGIAEQYGLTTKVLIRLQRDQLIGKPICRRDIRFLEGLSKVWSRPWYIRQQVSRYSKAQRQRLILDRPELSEKWQRWVYRQYLDSDIERGTGGRMLNPERIIKIRLLCNTLEQMFNLKPTPQVVATIKIIRKKAYRDKAKLKRQDQGLDHKPQNVEEGGGVSSSFLDQEYFDVLKTLYPHADL